MAKIMKSKVGPEVPTSIFLDWKTYLEKLLCSEKLLSDLSPRQS